MTKITLVEEGQATEKVKTIYAEIKKTFAIDFVPNLFKAMGNNPDYLANTWEQFKTTMGPGELTPREKELIALAVSVSNNCNYCIHAHTGSLKKMGLSEKGLLELMAVIGLYHNFNKFLDGLMIEPDLGV